MEAGGGGGGGVGGGESECIQYGQLENTKWERKVQGNAGKVNRGLEAMSSSRLLCLKVFKNN